MSVPLPPPPTPNPRPSAVPVFIVISDLPCYSNLHHIFLALAVVPSLQHYSKLQSCLHLHSSDLFSGGKKRAQCRFPAPICASEITLYLTLASISPLPSPSRLMNLPLPHHAFFLSFSFSACAVPSFLPSSCLLASPTLSTFPLLHLPCPTPFPLHKLLPLPPSTLFLHLVSSAPLTSFLSVLRSLPSHTFHPSSRPSILPFLTPMSYPAFIPLLRICPSPSPLSSNLLTLP